jgi:hypothetical protein
MAETNGGGVTDNAQQAAADVQEKGKEKAQEVRAQARSKLREQVDQRSTQAGQHAKGAAGDVRSVAEELRRQGKDSPARFAEQAADRVERAGGWLEESDGDRILRDVEDFGRRNPLAVVAGGVALGFAASRLLKASSRRRYEESRSWSGNGQAQRARLTPREGLTEAGLTGGTPATSPATTPPVGTPPVGTPPVGAPAAGAPTTSPPPPSTGWRDPDVAP